jgi:hypothetical protein
MPATPEADARTRALARVIGPWLVIVPGIIAMRAPEIGTFVSRFFENPFFVWFTGALLLFLGLLIIAFHQYWHSVTAVLISLFGWLLALRGFILMAAPQLAERVATSAADAPSWVHAAGFAVFALIGLWLIFAGWGRRSQ